MRSIPPHRPGFTLVESMVAISITALAGAVILLAIETSVQDTTDALDETMAAGMARQLVDEVLGARYMTLGGDPHQYPPGPSAWEQAGMGRERFDDTDDYHGFSAQPPEDLWGQTLGLDDGAGNQRHVNFQIRPDYFADWRQEISIYYVDPIDLSKTLPAGSTSDYRAVEVVIYRQQADGGLRELARLRRVFAYVPSAS